MNLLNSFLTAISSKHNKVAHTDPFWWSSTRKDSKDNNYSKNFNNAAMSSKGCRPNASARPCRRFTGRHSSNNSHGANNKVADVVDSNNRRCKVWNPLLSSFAINATYRSNNAESHRLCFEVKACEWVIKGVTSLAIRGLYGFEMRSSYPKWWKTINMYVPTYIYEV